MDAIDISFLYQLTKCATRVKDGRFGTQYRDHHYAATIRGAYCCLVMQQNNGDHASLVAQDIVRYLAEHLPLEKCSPSAQEIWTTLFNYLPKEA